MKRVAATLLLVLLCITAQARKVYPLNEGWRFFFKSENTSDNARYVTLPHTWNTDTEAVGLFLETTANYQNEVRIPAEWRGKRVFVKFYGVQNVATLFVNGNYVGEHRGGAAAFTFEITDKLRCGDKNALLVIVSNNSRSDVLPVSTDANLYGGIYRGAELIVTDRTAVSPLYFGSDGVLVKPTSVTPERVEGEAEIHLTSSSGEANCLLTLDITAPDGTRVYTRRQRVRLDGRPASVPFSVDDPELWSPDHAALYRFTVRLGEQQVLDEVSVRTGFRSVRVTPEERFTLNGSFCAIHGVTLYHDNALEGGALTDADYDADMACIRDLGANAVRSAVMPHAQYFYDLCDERGILVWAEIPFQRAPFLGDMGYFPTPQFEENGLQQLQEIIAQNYNHPSVVMWGIFSLLQAKGDDPSPYIRRLNDAAHRMDPTRPTVACSNQDGSLNFITDLIVWQQEVGWEKGSPDDVAVWRDLLRRNWSHLASGVCYGEPGFPAHQYNAVPPVSRTNWIPEQRQSRFHEAYAKNLEQDSLFWGVWVNNLFDYGSARRPYGVNGSGLMTQDRRERKDVYYLYRAMWNKRDTTLHLADKRHRLRDTERQAFKVYSSAGRPQLRINGDTVALRRYADCQYVTDTMTLQGTVWLKASLGGQSDSLRFRIDCAPQQPLLGVLRQATGR